MSKLYKITVGKNMIQKRVTEWNGRDSDELHGFDTVTKTIQDGWLVERKELKVDFSKEELQFEKSFAAIEAAKNENNLFAGCEISINYPSESTKSITDSNTEVLEERYIVLQEDEFDFITEELYAFVREGMSTTVTFAREANVTAPIKSNRQGHSIRGYAAWMDADSIQSDEEFYNYILSKF